MFVHARIDAAQAAVGHVLEAVAGLKPRRDPPLEPDVRGELECAPLVPPEQRRADSPTRDSGIPTQDSLKAGLVEPLTAP